MASDSPAENVDVEIDFGVLFGQCKGLQGMPAPVFTRKIFVEITLVYHELAGTTFQKDPGNRFLSTPVRPEDFPRLGLRRSFRFGGGFRLLRVARFLLFFAGRAVFRRFGLLRPVLFFLFFAQH